MIALGKSANILTAEAKREALRKSDYIFTAAAYRDSPSRCIEHRLRLEQTNLQTGTFNSEQEGEDSDHYVHFE